MGYLGYAVTAHRAQGATVDTAHALVRSTEVARESLYVAMTRGRSSNRVYVALDQAHLEEHQHRPPEEVTARTVLEGVLAHSAAEPSAHDATVKEQEAWSRIGQLAAEYDAIAQTAQQERWVRLLENSGLTPEQVDQACESNAFGPLAAELRRADANRYVPEQFLPALLAERPITGATDVAAVLRRRIQEATNSRTGSSRRLSPRLIAGLIPRATGITDPDLRRGLHERERLIEERVNSLVREALDQKQPWTQALGPMPNGRTRALWIEQAATVAAYRDRYQIRSPQPLGVAPATTSQRIDAARARAALERARAHAAQAKPRTREDTTSAHAHSI